MADVICPRCGWPTAEEWMWHDVCIACASDTGVIGPDLREHGNVEIAKALKVGDLDRVARIRRSQAC
jgi:hypothetical protein